MIPLIDCHLHLIEPRRFRYPWMKDVPSLARSFSLDEYTTLARESVVSAALFMEADTDGEDASEEARFFSSQVAPAGVLRGVIGSARPEDPDFEARLDAMASPHLKGIRRVLHVVPDNVSSSAIFRRHVRLLGGRGLVFDLCILPRQHALGLELVDACPETSFVLDHCGNPALGDLSAVESWKKSLAEFARRPNVVVKLSGMVASSPVKPAPFRLVRTYLDEAFGAFGVNRCLWGSDWPFCTLTTGLAEWVALFRTWMEELNPAEQAGVAQTNAMRVYRLAR